MKGRNRLLALIIGILSVATVAYGLTVNGELKKALLEKLASDPASYEARIYWDTVNKTAKIYNGTSWGSLGSGSGSGSGGVNFITNGDAEAASVPTT